MVVITLLITDNNNKDDDGKILIIGADQRLPAAQMPTGRASGERQYV